jgi:muramoyltetrapeptide carboxypeptidase
MALIWNYLQPGDMVDIIAPASSAPNEKLPLGVEALKEWNLIPRVPKGMIEPSEFFAAPLERQFEQLKGALHSDSKAIWCLRGGYGSMRLIPLLKKIKPPKKPKLFIGFSDITALHLYFNQVWKWPTIHGRTISQMDPVKLQTADRVALRSALFGEMEEVSFENLIPLNALAKKKKTISGEIIGGNLRLLQTSLRTDWELKAKGKILFIEDVSERGYSIHRMLEQLVQAKIIHSGLKALVIGDFTEGHEKDGKDHSQIAFNEFSERLPYPVLKGLPCGHGTQLNYALPFQSPTKVFLGESPRLVARVNGSSF